VPDTARIDFGRAIMHKPAVRTLEVRNDGNAVLKVAFEMDETDAFVIVRAFLVAVCCQSFCPTTLSLSSAGAIRAECDKY
jgi:hypothetical protein